MENEYTFDDVMDSIEVPEPISINERKHYFLGYVPKRCPNCDNTDMRSDQVRLSYCYTCGANEPRIVNTVPLDESPYKQPRYSHKKPPEIEQGLIRRTMTVLKDNDCAYCGNPIKPRRNYFVDCQTQKAYCLIACYRKAQKRSKGISQTSATMPLESTL